MRWKSRGGIRHKELKALTFGRQRWRSDNSVANKTGNGTPSWQYALCQEGMFQTLIELLFRVTRCSRGTRRSGFTVENHKLFFAHDAVTIYIFAIEGGIKVGMVNGFPLI